MADQPISQLSSANLPLQGVEELAIVQDGKTKKISSDNLKDSYVNNRHKTITINSGTYNIDFDAYSSWDITIAGNVTLTFSNIPPLGKSKTIVIYIVGQHALTLPVEWAIKNGGTYDGINGSQIVIMSWDNGNFYTVINNEQ